MCNRLILHEITWQNVGMKKIEAIIQEERLNEVKNALEEKGFVGLTISHVSGRGQQKGISLQWRVGEYRADF